MSALRTALLSFLWLWLSTPEQRQALAWEHFEPIANRASWVAILSVGALFAAPLAVDSPLSELLFALANIWGILCLKQIGAPIKIERERRKASANQR